MADFGSLAPDMGPPAAPPDDAVLRILRMMQAQKTAPDRLIPPANANPQTAVPGALARMFAPNITSLMSGEPDPQQFSNTPLPSQGKVPSTDDPRHEGAINEAGMLAASLMPAGRMAMGAQGAGRMIPEVMQNSFNAFPAAGKLAGGASLASILGTGSDAGENKFEWTDPNPERVGRINGLQSKIDANDTKIDGLMAQIAKRSEQITELGTTITKSPKGTQDKAIDNLKAANETAKNQVDQLNDLQKQLRGQHKELSDSQTGERNTAMGEFRAKVSREMPFAEKYPNAPLGITLGTPVFSAGTGMLAGRAARPFVGGKAGRYGTIAGAMVPGAVEGAASQYYQNEADVTGLPQGSPGQARATENVTDPQWLARLGLGALGSAAFGGLGAKWGLGTAGKTPARLPPISMPSQGPPPAPMPQAPSPPPSPMPQAAPMPQAPPAAPQSPVDMSAFAISLERPGQITSGGRPLKQASDGTWRDNGKFASTPAEALPLDPFGQDMTKTLRYWATLPADQRAARVQQLLRDRPELKSILGDIGK